MLRAFLVAVLLSGISMCCNGELLPVDLSAVHSGPIGVTQAEGEFSIAWKDAANHMWRATFSLDPAKPPLHEVTVDGRALLHDARPVYRGAVGLRKGGWDVFFDDPSGEPDGTRRYVAKLAPTAVAVRSVGNRVEVSFSGMKMGPFEGRLCYDFYPNTSLIQQVAVMKTGESNVAYYYDAGLDWSAEDDRTAGLNMASQISYYEPTGDRKTIKPPYGSERHTVQVAYRAVAARAGTGSVVVFPSPHRYFFSRDYSTNLGYNWYSSWRGRVSLGIQQQPDDNTAIYPWMNAPPDTEQEMSVFLLLSAEPGVSALEQVKEFTHGDRFPHLPGYVTFAPHWHFAYTVQAMANGKNWIPPFKPTLEQHGIDAAMIMDFHIDGHPGALTDVRLKELDAYYKACRAQSDAKFLIIPAEEADVLLGGHWGLVFPSPVMWFEGRKPDQSFVSQDPQYGNIYHVSTPDEMWKMITAEHGIAYQTHPRTKGSTGYPDKILDTSYFRAPQYIGVGWKAMPTDLSSPGLGERGFKVLDDLNNRGLHKIMLGEDDLFQIFPTDELYAHLNANYVKMARLPDFDHYGDLLESVTRGDGFISTGEVLLPEANFSSTKNSVRFDALVDSTFPLRVAEIVWGDGKETHHEMVPLASTGAFEHHRYQWSAATPGWTWARLAVWDVAGDGGFTNPWSRNIEH